MPKSCFLRREAGYIYGDAMEGKSSAEQAGLTGGQRPGQWVSLVFYS